MSGAGDSAGGGAGRGAAPPILVTRPEAQARATAAALTAQGWAPVLCPLLDLRALPDAPDYRGARGLVFTSANGVRAAGAPDFALDLPAYCVGAATAEAARAAGFRDLRAGDGDAAALAGRILDAVRAGELAGGPLLHPRGVHGTAGLAEALAAGGVELRAAPVYEMIAAQALSPAAQAALAGAAPVAALFYSPRTARIFARLARGAAAPLHAIVISAAAAQGLAGAAVAQLRLAETPTGSAMLAAAQSLFRQGFAPGSRAGR